MSALRFLRSALCVWLAFAMLELGPAARTAHAGMVTTEQALAAPDAADDTRARVQAFLLRDDVARELERFGVDRDDARARVALLSDAEISRIAGKIDALPAGANAVVDVLVIIVIVFLILVFLDAVGVTDLFPWVNKPRR